MNTPKQQDHETLAARAEYDRLIDKLIELEGKVNTAAPEDVQAVARMRMQLHHDLHTRRRHIAHDKAIAARPLPKTEHHEDDFTALVKYLRQPLTHEELAPGGLDLIARNVKESESTGDLHRLLWDLAMFFRKTWGENQAWGDITSEVKR